MWCKVKFGRYQYVCYCFTEWHYVKKIPSSLNESKCQWYCILKAMSASEKFGVVYVCVYKHVVCERKRWIAMEWREIIHKSKQSKLSLNRRSDEQTHVRNWQNIRTRREKFWQNETNKKIKLRKIREFSSDQWE